jgi:hypothetical protein
VQANFLFFNFSPFTFRTKPAALLVAFFVFFNFTFAPYAGALTVPINPELQKDMFSAVLFVSRTISKMSSAISDKIAPADDSSKPENKKPSENSGKTAKKNVFIQNEKTENSAQNLSSGVKTIKFFDSSQVSPGLLKRFDRRIVFYFLESIIYYISCKKPYDISSFNNNAVFNKKPS